MKRNTLLQFKQEIYDSVIINGNSMQAVAKEFGCSVTAIKRILTLVNPDHKVKTNTSKISSEVLDQFLADFAESKNVAILSKKYNISESCVRNTIIKYAPNLWAFKHKDTYDKDFFKSIDSDDKAYILGFTAADGCCTQDFLTYTVNKKDREVLEFILKSLQLSNTSVKTLKKDQVRLAKKCKTLCEDLNNLGVTPRKSLTLGAVWKMVPKIHRKAFLLGYFDGDGSIYITKKGKVGINVRGTKEMLEGYLQELNLNLNLHKYDSTWVLASTNKSVVKSFYQLYDNNSNFCLKRKKNKFPQALEQSQ